jgi:hypothetical protein
VVGFTSVFDFFVAAFTLSRYIYGFLWPADDKLCVDSTQLSRPVEMSVLISPTHSLFLFLLVSALCMVSDGGCDGCVGVGGSVIKPLNG